MNAVRGIRGHRLPVCQNRKVLAFGSEEHGVRLPADRHPFVGLHGEKFPAKRILKEALKYAESSSTISYSGLCLEKTRLHQMAVSVI
jgi:hypothetical protein